MQAKEKKAFQFRLNEKGIRDKSIKISFQEINLSIKYYALRKNGNFIF